MNATGSAWQASLSLGFAPKNGRTVMARRTHSGPLCVQRPFYPQGDACQVYVLHPPGGVVGGDRLTVEVEVASGASVLLTTPASTKVYRSAEPVSEVTQRLTVDNGGCLEWLPQDTILFGGSRVNISTEVRLGAGARFIGWEVTGLGRPLSGDDYASGSLSQRMELYVDNHPALIEHQRWDGGDAVLDAPWGLGGYRVFAMLCAYPADGLALKDVRRVIEEGECPRGAATLLDELLVVRALGTGAQALRQTLQSVWEVLREPIVGRAPCPPRIWRT